MRSTDSKAAIELIQEKEKGGITLREQSLMTAGFLTNLVEIGEWIIVRFWKDTWLEYLSLK